jgi:hypothetical protein
MSKLPLDVPPQGSTEIRIRYLRPEEISDGILSGHLRVWYQPCDCGADDSLATRVLGWNVALN